MSAIGDSLRDARMAKKVSVSQAAEATNIKVQILEGLENDNYSTIPAPIYGRGFVKMYAAYLDLEPQPVIDGYMEIVEGKQMDTHRVDTPLSSAASGRNPERKSIFSGLSALIPKFSIKTPEGVQKLNIPERIAKVKTALVEEPIKWTVAGVGVVAVAIFLVSGVTNCGRKADVPAAGDRAGPAVLHADEYHPPEPYLEISQ